MPRCKPGTAGFAAKAAAPPLRTGAGFRKRYDELERQRAELIDRLSALGENTRTHPARRRALKLLNQTFRKSSLSKRIGVLQAASWLLHLIERLTLTL